MSTFAAREIIGRQIGAIRWHQGPGVASEIYVAPQMRRRGVATALWNTARNLHALTTGGRPLQVSGRRTVLGDLLARRLCDPPAPLSELVLPMTPQSEASGAEQRQLAPDDIEESVLRYRYLGVPDQVLQAYCSSTTGLDQALPTKCRIAEGSEVTGAVHATNRDVDPTHLHRHLIELIDIAN
ncbi:GNAT family N-acetyltransferase [Nocardiopsis sp. NPDC006139]|uniref:GNAT family N-acetyltransferase n=1 Tax=Nocardiopsis sp. NPDC006139 TaxID=3154578 RepID=UPI0033A2D9AF